MTDISVIMVSYHTGLPLFEAIDAVLFDPDIGALIVVNNGNDAAALDRLTTLSARHAKLSLIDGHGNIGFGRACNLGAQAASSDYLLFLNPDAIIERGAATILKTALKGRAAPAIAGACLVDIEGHEQRGSRRMALTWRSFLSGFNRHTEATPEAVHTIPTISGAAFMMRAADFEAIEGFDPRYFLHVEDIDLCHRARAAGGDVVSAPRAKVMHYGATSNAPRLSVEWHKAKSFVLFFTSHTRGVKRAIAYLCAPVVIAVIMLRALMR